MSNLKFSRNRFVGTARYLAAACMLCLAVPASAGQFVDMFRTVCLETAPKFTGAAELAVEAGATRGPDVFDSHTRYFNDETPFSVQFRHLAEDTHQCEVVTPLIGKGEETKDFYRLIETFAGQQKQHSLKKADEWVSRQEDAVSLDTAELTLNTKALRRANQRVYYFGDHYKTE